MSIWKIDIKPEQINANAANTMVDYLGIEVVELGDDYIKATMPVDHRTVQPYRLLHGGASVVLAETLGSIGAGLIVAPDNKQVVGIEINANHMKSAKEGTVVTAIAKPIHLGRRTHVWNIEITNEAGELACVSRLTMAIIEPKTY